MPNCELKAGQIYDGSTELDPDCTIEPGAVIQFDFGNEGSAQAPKAAVEMLPTPQIVFMEEKVPPAAALREEFLKGSKMPETENVVSTPAPAEVPAPAPELQSHTEAPASAPSAADLQGIMGAAGGNSGLAIAMALIAGVGSAAGLKVITKMLDSRAELQMEDKKLAREMAGLQGAQPPPCQAANGKILADIAALQATVSAQEARLAKAERVTGTLNPNFDGADLEERVERIEKTLRKRSQE
jgi:hypothetical protein